MYIHHTLQKIFANSEICKSLKCPQITDWRIALWLCNEISQVFETAIKVTIYWYCKDSHNSVGDKEENQLIKQCVVWAIFARRVQRCNMLRKSIKRYAPKCKQWFSDWVY